MNQANAIFTEIIDLDNVRKAREFGSLGLCQLWKQMRDVPVDFPPYVDGIGKGKVFHNLGRLQFHRQLELDGPG